MINNNSIITFFPSSSCVPCARTLSTLDGSANVMNPNPLEKEKTSKETTKLREVPSQNKRNTKKLKLKKKNLLL